MPLPSAQALFTGGREGGDCTAGELQEERLKERSSGLNARARFRSASFELRKPSKPCVQARYDIPLRLRHALCQERVAAVPSMQQVVTCKPHSRQ